MLIAVLKKIIVSFIAIFRTFVQPCACPFVRLFITKTCKRYYVKAAELAELVSDIGFFSTCPTVRFKEEIMPTKLW